MTYKQLLNNNGTSTNGAQRSYRNTANVKNKRQLNNEFDKAMRQAIGHILVNALSYFSNTLNEFSKIDKENKYNHQQSFNKKSHELKGQDFVNHLMKKYRR